MNARGSWKLGELAGIGVYLHWTFFILPAVVALSTLQGGGGLWAAIDAVLFVLAIFGCVVLHELGHALMARHHGITTRDITLYPIGGVARLDRMPTRPSQELAVALAGPAVNVLIAFLLLVSTGLAADLGPESFGGGTFFGNLMWVNVALVVFNMIPAFPMDGGRVLRSILALHMPYGRATEVAAGVGQAMAILLGIVGLLAAHWTLMLIAVFVYFAAGAEAQQARIWPPFEPFEERDEAAPPFHALSADWRLAHVADALLLSPQHVFPVMAGSRFIGMLCKADVLHAMAHGLGHLRVGDLVRPR